MAKSNLEKYVRDGLMIGGAPSPEVTAPALILRGGKNGFGTRDFELSWSAISQPFEIVSEHHVHDFDQFLMFVGGDITNMVDLGGEVELTLSEDGINRETFVFSKATMVYVPAGLHHGPVIFKKISDPAKPILFHDFFFASEYGRA